MSLQRIVWAVAAVAVFAVAAIFYLFVIARAVGGGTAQPDSKVSAQEFAGGYNVWCENHSLNRVVWDSPPVALPSGAKFCRMEQGHEQVRPDGAQASWGFDGTHLRYGVVCCLKPPFGSSTGVNVNWRPIFRYPQEGMAGCSDKKSGRWNGVAVAC
jgi:hypothetical protein